VRIQNDPGKLPRSERHKNPGTRLHPMTQGQRQRIGERFVDGSGNAHIAEFGNLAQ
jgi:hypothetical protein